MSVIFTYTGRSIHWIILNLITFHITCFIQSNVKSTWQTLVTLFFTSSVLTQNWLCWNLNYVFKDFSRIKLYHLLKPITSNIGQINKITVSNTCSWKNNLFICIHVIVWFEYTCSAPETILYTQWNFFGLVISNKIHNNPSSLLYFFYL